MNNVLILPGMNTSTHFVHTAIIPKLNNIQCITGNDDFRASFLHPTDESRQRLLATIDPSKPLLIADGAITAHDPLIGISNCAEMFPNAKVMVTMSNQWDTLISNYLHQIDKGLYFLPFKTFLMSERTGRVLKTTSATDIIAMLMEKFDRRVTVFFHEEYKHSIEAVVQQILQNLGSDQEFATMSFEEKIDFQNETIVGLSMIMRMYNLAYFAFNIRLLPPKVRNFVESGKGWIGRQVRDSRRLADRKERKINEYKNLITSMYGDAFEHSNHNLEKILGRDLPPEYFPSQVR
jgi:hypothetical protein